MMIRMLRDLLATYWIPADSPEERARQIAIMVKDLAVHPDCCVVWAIHEWRTTMDRRPSVAALLQLCARRKTDLINRRDALWDRSRPEPEPEHVPTEQELFDRRLAQERLMTDAGYVRTRTGWVSEAEIAEQAQPRKPHWSETAEPDDPRHRELAQARAAANKSLGQFGRF